MRVRIWTFVVIASVVGVSMYATLAQAPAGVITGTVRDAQGAALPGVAVHASGPHPSRSMFSATTDAQGAFSIANLPPGAYRVEFVLTGFVTHAREHVTVADGGRAALAVAMRPGSSANVDVVAEPAPAAGLSPPPPAPPPPSASPLTVGGGGGGGGGGVYRPGGVGTGTGVGQGSGVGFGSGSGSGVASGSGSGTGPVVAGGLGRAVQGGVAGGVVGGTLGGVPGGVPDAAQGRLAGAARDTTLERASGDSYAAILENPFLRVTTEPVSTFSIDTDSASFANVRRFLQNGTRPPPDAVRIEELVNYFRFDYPQPRRGEPFSVTTELADAPWNPKHRLALIGLQGRTLPRRDVPRRNLVFLLDVSGSMASADKLPLVQSAMRMLVDTLRPSDRVAIVVYAGSSGLALPSTPGDRRAEIHDAIAALQAGGSTNGASGLRLAYQVAREHVTRDGVNRVILATDGDFNVGVTSNDELLQLIEEERKTGVFLSVLGVGTGNLQDDRMEMLADKGNGNYSYLDSLHEARRVLVEEAGATLVTIAKDVKIQVEFNPRTVNAYRLIGYENRLLRREDFNDDGKDAGEIGAGHSVTALYEIVPAGVELEPPAEPLRYQREVALEPTTAASANELITVNLRYKAPDADTSLLLTHVVRPQPKPLKANLGFASAVAEFGMLLRHSPHRGDASFEAVIERARRFRGRDEDGYRAELIRLAEQAAGLRNTATTSSSESD